MDDKLEQIKNLISKFANEASDKELSMLLEIAAFANTEYNQKLFSHVNNEWIWVNTIFDGINRFFCGPFSEVCFTRCHDFLVIGFYREIVLRVRRFINNKVHVVTPFINVGRIATLTK